MSSQNRALISSLLLTCNIILGNGLPPQKIIEGKLAVQDEFPYLVSIRKNDKHYCGGAIISEQHILTAAHCVQGHMVEPYSDIVVVSGTNRLGKSGKRHTVKKAMIHPKFVLNAEIYYPNDIAVLELSVPMVFNKHQNKVNLPTSDVRYGSKGVVAGWGPQKNSLRVNVFLLLQVTVSILESNKCRDFLQNLNYEGKLCGVYSVNQGTCGGDSGGPLVVNDVVVGVLSWGTEVCGGRDPDIYTNVYANMDFIRKQMM